MSRRTKTTSAAWELTAFVVGMLATVPLIFGMTIAVISRVTGHTAWAMVLAPVVLWSMTWVYWRAFAGAKEILQVVREAVTAPSLSDERLERLLTGPSLKPRS